MFFRIIVLFLSRTLKMNGAYKMESSFLLHTAYFPPVQYFSVIKDSELIRIEQYDHYGKQSYRNRCRILSANGPLTLSVPVKKATAGKQLTKDVRIDYATPWQKLHFKGIESAYRNSPYYEHYIAYFQEFFHLRETYLIELNHKILTTFLHLLSLHPEIDYTSDFEPFPTEVTDLRDAIHPKESRRRKHPGNEVKPYHQTFAERFSFVPDLSMLDLLFNTGAESKMYL